MATLQALFVANLGDTPESQITEKIMCRHLRGVLCFWSLCLALPSKAALVAESFATLVQAAPVIVAGTVIETEEPFEKDAYGGPVFKARFEVKTKLKGESEARIVVLFEPKLSTSYPLVKEREYVLLLRANEGLYVLYAGYLSVYPQSPMIYPKFPDMSSPMTVEALESFVKKQSRQ